MKQLFKQLCKTHTHTHIQRGTNLQSQPILISPILATRREVTKHPNINKQKHLILKSYVLSSSDTKHVAKLDHTSAYSNTLK